LRIRPRLWMGRSPADQPGIRGRALAASPPGNGHPLGRQLRIDGLRSAGLRPLLPYQPFRERTQRDEYWGAKLVASFSDAQIAAAIDAAGYEDPRAQPFLLRTLIERRNKVMRYWFERVAPLDFFAIEAGELTFRDLAVDRGLEAPRAYEVRVEGGP